MEAGDTTIREMLTNAHFDWEGGGIFIKDKGIIARDDPILDKPFCASMPDPCHENYRCAPFVASDVKAIYFPRYYIDENYPECTIFALDLLVIHKDLAFWVNENDTPGLRPFE